MFFRLLSLIFVVLFFSGCATTTDPKVLQEPIRYTYEFEGLDAEQIHTKSRLWIGEVFNSAESVITLDDKESGVLRGTGVSVVGYMMYDRQFRYNLLVESREGRSRLSFSNIQKKDYYNSVIGGKVAGMDPKIKDMYVVIRDNIDKIANSYEESIKKQPEDW